MHQGRHRCCNRHRALGLAALFFVSFSTASVGFAEESQERGNFLDVRLTWTFGDDDVLHDAEEGNPLPSFGDRPGYEHFYENLNTRYSGRENLSHLVLYKSVPSFLDEQLTVDIAGIMLINFAALYSPDVELYDVFRDDGSYVRLFWNWSRARPRDGLEVVLFPLSTDRVRIGYLWDLSWGGDRVFTQSLSLYSPGLKLQIRSGNFYAYVSMKAAIAREELENEDGSIQMISETNYGGLGGLGMDALPWLRFDVSGGFFQQGTLPITGFRGEDTYTYGGAARLVFHQGVPIATSPDFALYRGDPAAEELLARREEYVPGELSWSLALEGHLMGQRLATDSGEFESVDQLGWAAAVQFLIKWGYLRGTLSGVVRNTPFLLHRIPSIVPYMEIDEEGVETTPEFFGAVGLDYHFQRPRLTLGGSVGILIPASYENETAEYLWVLDENGFRSPLPSRDGSGGTGNIEPVIAGRVFLQWDVASILSLVGSVQYGRDPNQTTRVATPEGEVLDYRDEHSLGFYFMAQGRF